MYNAFQKNVIVSSDTNKACCHVESRGKIGRKWKRKGQLETNRQ